MPVDGKPGSGPRGELTPEERAALERRSGELGRKLDEARHHGASGGPGQGHSGGGPSQGQAMGRGLQLSGELIGGAVAGGAIGWFLYKWLGNDKPWLFILFFLLGVAAGMRNLIRSAMQQKTPPLPSVRDERDEDK